MTVRREGWALKVSRRRSGGARRNNVQENFMRRLLAITRGIIVLTVLARAGGPEYVAGTSYFDPAVKGVPLTWAQGAINYYTDQGDLSPILLGANADSFVANAFGRWTSISTVAISAAQAGHLAEDVSGANFNLFNGVLNMPADILPGATANPIGIVYDEDGRVIDALLGSGASAALYCAGNSVIGGIDNLGTNAQFLHALIIMNGNCAQSSSQLP